MSSAGTHLNTDAERCRRLEKELAKCTEENRKLVLENSQLRGVNASLTRECTELKGGIQPGRQRDMYSALEDENRQLRAENASLRQVNAALVHERAQQEKTLASLQEALKERDGTIQRLREEKGKLTNKLAHAQSILNNNSTNTSIPPASNKYNKRKAANEYNERDDEKKKAKTRRNAGGQKDHPGKTLTAEQAEALISSGSCLVEEYENGKPGYGPAKTRYVLDLVTMPVVRVHKFWPGSDGKYGMPEELMRTVVTYGPEIKAEAACLYGEGVLSVSRIASFLETQTKGAIRMSCGTVWNFLQEAARKSEAAENEITRNLLGAHVLPTDATVMNLGGANVYVRCFCGEKDVLYVPLAKKNLEELGKIPLLAAFTGILLHDHETAMYHFGSFHAECNVHLLRYLRKCLEESKHSWCTRLMDLLLWANEAVKAAGGELTMAQARLVEDEYDKILKLGRKQNAASKEADCVKQDEKALLNRLAKYKDSQLLFMYEADVDFSNNISEKALRQCKTRDKVSGAFRSFAGLEAYCRLLTIVETAKKRGLKPYDVLRSIFTVPDYTLEPEAESASAK